MCEPTTWIMVAGLVLSAAGAAYSVDAGNKAAEAQEDQSKENAKAAEASGRNVTLSAQVEEDRRRQQTRQMLASQRTTFAANGVDMSTGTPLEILGDTAAIGEQDALTIRANAARQAWGYSVEANNSLNQGRMAVVGAKNNAIGTYLTTAGSMAQQGASIAGNRTSRSSPNYVTTSTPNTNYSYGSGARYS
jgi:hypothetical protein